MGEIWFLWLKPFKNGKKKSSFKNDELAKIENKYYRALLNHQSLTSKNGNKQVQKLHNLVITQLIFNCSTE